MFTAKDAQAMVITAREVAEAIKKQEAEAEEKRAEELRQQAEEKVDESLAKALEAVEEAAGKPLSTTKFEVGHRQGSSCPRTEKLTELVMEKLSDLGYRVTNTSSESKEQTETVHYKATVWRYEITDFIFTSPIDADRIGPHILQRAVIGGSKFVLLCPYLFGSES